ncbi:helix-turn-helix protein [compost metagenome]
MNSLLCHFVANRSSSNSYLASNNPQLSQAGFAKKLGISVQSLCDLEKGRRIPSPSRAAKIAKKIGYPELALITLALRDSLYSEGFKYNVKLEGA